MCQTDFFPFYFREFSLFHSSQFFFLSFFPISMKDNRKFSSSESTWTGGGKLNGEKEITESFNFEATCAWIFHTFNCIVLAYTNFSHWQLKDCYKIKRFFPCFVGTEKYMEIFFFSSSKILKIGACHVGQTKKEKKASSCSHLCVTFHAEKLVNWGRERERKSVSWLGKLLFSFHRKRFFFLLFKMCNLFEGTIRTKKIRLNLATINISFINYMSRFAISSFLLKQKLALGHWAPMKT